MCAIFQVAQRVDAAIQAAIDKQLKKQQAMTEKVSAATDSRQRTELEAALKNEEHKAKQLQQVQADFKALVAGVCEPLCRPVGNAKQRSLSA